MISTKATPKRIDGSINNVSSYLSLVNHWSFIENIAYQNCIIELFGFYPKILTYFFCLSFSIYSDCLYQFEYVFFTSKISKWIVLHRLFEVFDINTVSQKDFFLFPNSFEHYIFNIFYKTIVVVVISTLPIKLPHTITTYRIFSSILSFDVFLTCKKLFEHSLSPIAISYKYPTYSLYDTVAKRLHCDTLLRLLSISEV